MFVSRSFARSLLGAASLLALGCSAGGPSRPVSDLSLDVFTQGGGTHDYEMAVGERVRARVTTMATEGCLFDSPCEVSVRVELQSSEPNVIALDQGRLMTPGEFWLTGKHVGTSMISAHVDGRTAARLVYVVGASSTADTTMTELKGKTAR